MKNWSNDATLDNPIFLAFCEDDGDAVRMTKCCKKGIDDGNFVIMGMLLM